MDDIMLCRTGFVAEIFATGCRPLTRTSTNATMPANPSSKSVLFLNFLSINFLLLSQWTQARHDSPPVVCCAGHAFLLDGACWPISCGGRLLTYSLSGGYPISPHASVLHLSFVMLLISPGMPPFRFRFP